VSVNKALPYLFVLPEDRANRQLAIGFYLQIDKSRQMQILKVSGGWTEALRLFESVHVSEMERDENRFILLLLDFDDHLNRLEHVRAVIPEHLKDRVFVLGSRTTPEKLRQALRRESLDSYEKIGAALALDCRENTDKTWRHDLLQHNVPEVERLRTHIRPILFNSI